MPSISLAPYTLRIHQLGDRTPMPLGDLNGAGDDALDLLVRFFADLEKATDHDEKTRSLLRLKRFDFDEKNRRLEGVIETGEYGYETSLVDVEIDENLDSYRRKVSEAELIPFYFLVELPRRPDQGFVVLQRLGAVGIKGSFERALGEFFRKTQYRVELNPLVPDAVIQWWGGARRVRSLRLVRFEVPKNVARAFRLGDRKEIYAELVIRAKKGTTFPLPERFMKRSGDGMVELQDLQGELAALRGDLEGVFEPDELKLEVDVDGKTRTVQATDPGKLSAYHDVTQSVSPPGENGHPIWENMRVVAHDLLDDLHRTVSSLQPALDRRTGAGRRREDSTGGAETSTERSRERESSEPPSVERKAG